MRLNIHRRKLKAWLVTLVIIFTLPIFGYTLWSPGKTVSDGRHDLGSNGIWMSHRWLGNDNWFTENNREHLREQYRDPANINTVLAMLSDRGITDLFPHLAPTRSTGELPGHEDEQLKRFLDAASQNNQRVIPWIGGVFENQCHPASATWREQFIASVLELLTEHPRLAGVQINIEPWPNGDADCLLLLEELKAAMPDEKLLSIAAYPPPTRWQPATEVHWDESYFRAVAERCDQLAVMMYDTSIPLSKPYIALMDKWTKEVLAWSGNTDVLLGLPCYEDADVDYHNPAVENLPNALRGIHAGLTSESLPSHYSGVALYSLWTMDEQEWEAMDRLFLKTGTR